MLNSFRKKIQFTCEVESNAKLPFLDVLLIQNDEDVTTTVYRKEVNSNLYLHCDSLTAIPWKSGTLKTLIERAYLICSTPRLLEKELNHIRTVFKNTNCYLYWICNHVLEQIKVKQRDPVPNNNVSNKNEATQTSNQTIVEKYDDKKHLFMIVFMILYQGKKGEQVI